MAQPKVVVASKLKVNDHCRPVTNKAKANYIVTAVTSHHEGEKLVVDRVDLQLVSCMETTNGCPKSVTLKPTERVTMI